MRTSIKPLIGVMLLLIGIASFFWFFPNLFSAAPVAWSVKIGKFEGPWWCDNDSVYCVTSICGQSGSESGLSRFDRVTGKRIWSRHQTTGPEKFRIEKGHVFVNSKCYLASELYDREKKCTLECKLLEIDLMDGKITTEISASGETGGLALDGSTLYRITTDGVLAAYDLNTHQKTWELNLDVFGHHASYGGVVHCQNALMIHCNISTNYTLPEHARTIIVSTITHERVAETSRGLVVGSRMLTFDAERTTAYDLKSLVQTDSQLPNNTFILESKCDSTFLLWAIQNE